MIYKKFKRGLAAFLGMLLLFTSLSLYSAAATQGSFILAVSLRDDTVIEPVRIAYEEEQTIREALIASDYQFEGIEDSIITAVNGVSGSYSIFCDDGSYDIDRAANLVTVVEFTELTEDEINFDGRADLLIAMEEYLSMDTGVQDYAPAAKAYKDALKGLRRADGASQKLLDTLQTEINNYDKVISGNDIRVNVAAYQDEILFDDPLITFTDENGYTRETIGDYIELGLSGDYDFVISDGGYNRTEGSIHVPESGADLTVSLPIGEWFGDITVTRPDFTNEEKTSRIPYEGIQDYELHTAEYFIEDSYDYEDELLYIFAKQGEDIPDAENTTLRTIYTGLDGEDKSEEITSWESRYAQLNSALTFGMEGTEFPLEAWYEYTAENGDIYRMIQSYEITLTRIPTCVEILLTDQDGVLLYSDFHGKTYEYEVSTSSSVLNVEATPFETEGYSVTLFLNGEEIEEMTCSLSKGENEVSVMVSHENGQDNTYIFHVMYEDTCKVTMNLQGNGYTYDVYNENNSKIEPSGMNLYKLIPGEKYYYIATKNEQYHAAAQFTAKEGLKVNVAEPKIETALQGIALYDTANVTNRLEILPDQAFSSDCYEYTYTASDALTGNAYLQATGTNDYTLNAIYEGQYSTSNQFSNQKTAITTAVDSTQKATTLNRVYVKGGYGNVITLRAEKTVNSCTYYQDYTLNLQRYLSLTALEIATEAGNSLLFDNDKNMISFDRDTFEYYLYLPSDTEALTFNGTFMNEGDPEKLWFNGGYYAQIKDQKITSLSDVTVTLDTNKASEDVELMVCHESESAKTTTYLLHLIKNDAIDVTFRLTPKDALVFMVNELDGSRIFPDAKGNFQLMPGFSYSYTVTANGYVGKSVKNYQPDASAESSKVTIRLVEAQKNTTLKEPDALWPTFRDGNNNAVLDEKLPTKAEETVLYWALGKDSDDTDDIIDGFDGSCGHPILVDDYLYTYDNQHVYKINKIDGSIAAISPDKLVAKSSFAIQGMTYAEGMVFVGLSNGSVQAFHADTLESLWVYTDEFGGQPNSVITYQDGYIYTGFWISETDYANYVCISVTDEDPEDHFEKKYASWVHHQKGGFYWAGAFATEDFLLVGTDDGESGYSKGYAHLLSLNPKTGEVISDLTLPHVGDLRTSITYDANETKDYYFATKGGYLYRVSVNEDGVIDENTLRWVRLENGADKNVMSTSTPTIYNGRAYVGVSGTGQFAAYSGHNISVIDLKKMETAYIIPTKGYPQTSGILTTAYSSNTDKVNVYFFDNYTPGKLRMFTDEPGQTELLDITTEVQQTSKGEVSYDTGYVLFTPTDAQAQYAICSPVVDEHGIMYFRNDSNYMMAVGSTIEKIEITQLPKKTAYRPGSIFDPEGMEVTAAYTNGMTRDITDYVTFSTEPLTENDTEFAITFEHVMYQDVDGVAGVEYTAPMASITLEINENMVEEKPKEVTRLFGSGRYETGYAVADALKEALGVEKFEAVVIATGKNFADALAGSYLAVEKNAPILLTNGKDDNVAALHAYIKENVTEGGKIYILGGEAAVPAAVETIEGYDVVRLFGTSRYDTNLAILEEAGINGDSIIIATGKTFADSLSASAAKLPILLVKPNGTLNDAQKAILSDMNSIYIVGGEGAVSAAYETELKAFGEVTRVFGNSRYDTSVEVAKTFCGDVDTAVVASGKNFPDGLCGGPLAAALNAPLILTKDGGTDAAAAYIAEQQVDSGYILGGEGALSNETVTEVFGDHNIETP